MANTTLLANSGLLGTSWAQFQMVEVEQTQALPCAEVRRKSVSFQSVGRKEMLQDGVIETGGQGA